MLFRSIRMGGQLVNSGTFTNEETGTLTADHTTENGGVFENKNPDFSPAEARLQLSGDTGEYVEAENLHDTIYVMVTDSYGFVTGWGALPNGYTNDSDSPFYLEGAGQVWLENHSYTFYGQQATTEIYTLSLHDALPISWYGRQSMCRFPHW